MKQALTAGGLISVWFESAKIAFEKLGIDFEENLDLPQLTGTHPEYGEITIDFFVPVQGKTRMEIAVQDDALIAAFKKNVVPAFKYVSALAEQQTETEAETEEDTAAESETDVPQEEDAQYDDASETDAPQPEDEAEAEPAAAQDTVPQETEEHDEVPNQDEPADEEKVLPIVEPEAAQPAVRYCKHCHAVLQDGARVCPECGKKQKSSGPLIAGIIIIILILLGAAGFAAYKLAGGGEFSLSKIKVLLLGGSSTTETTDTTTVLVSLEQLNQTQKGMSYEDVCAVMGSKGNFLEPETQLIYSNGNVVSLKTYYWNAQGDSGANICVTFRNGVAETISQTGLK